MNCINLFTHSKRCTRWGGLFNTLNKTTCVSKLLREVKPYVFRSLTGAIPRRLYVLNVTFVYCPGGHLHVCVCTWYPLGNVVYQDMSHTFSKESIIVFKYIKYVNVYVLRKSMLYVVMYSTFPGVNYVVLCLSGNINK
jgi:hypothetical protein